MTGWDLVTWMAIGVLGPGALVIFIAFLRDVRQLFGRDRRHDDPGP